jgi:cytochrome c1
MGGPFWAGMARLCLLSLMLALAGCLEDAAQPPPHLQVPGGDAARGRALMAEHGCGSCHRIPGVRNATALLGPPLDEYARRGHVAGVLPNRPANLVAWLRDPPSIRPGTAMPAQGLDEAAARDMAAYLYTLGARGTATAAPVTPRPVPEALRLRRPRAEPSG